MVQTPFIQTLLMDSVSSHFDVYIKCDECFTVSKFCRGFSTAVTQLHQRECSYEVLNMETRLGDTTTSIPLSATQSH